MNPVILPMLALLIAIIVSFVIVTVQEYRLHKYNSKMAMKPKDND